MMVYLFEEGLRYFNPRAHTGRDFYTFSYMM